jgi:ABC-2 type transport system ATP-binding protein
MDEAEKFCTDIAIIDKGVLIAEGKPRELIEQTDGCSDLEEVFLKLTGRKNSEDD